ncbi:MAG: ComF family protein [Veillonella sp.]|nr:ComF family protein [Veillonella sp.]
MCGLKQWLLDFLYPPTCPHCGAEVKRTGDWCPSCLASVLHIHQVAPSELHHLDRVSVLASYTGGIKTMIHDVKFNGKEERARWAAPLLSALDAANHFTYEPHLVIPIPINEAKRKSRGYNQVDLFFKDWVESKRQAGHWHWYDILHKGETHDDMWHLSQVQRREQVDHLFSIPQSNRLAGRRILLVDDIYTTGATLEAAAQVIRAYGPKSVEALVLASGRA